MIGLTPYARDLELPEACGDSRLVLPDADALAELVAHTPGVEAPGIAVSSVELSHVRYKPGVAVSGTYVMTLETGEQRAVTLKVHVHDKARVASPGGRYAEQLSDACAPLHPYVALQDPGRELWTFPSDPALRGVIRVMDKRRTARWVDRSGVANGRVVRLRPSTLVLRRYKFGRRAVFHFVAKLRGPEGQRDVREFGVRVHSPEVALRTVEFRRALEASGEDLPIPRMLLHDPASGALLEEWLAGDACRRDDFEKADEALACVAQLHRIPLPASHAGGARRRVSSLDGLDRIPGSDRLLRRFEDTLLCPQTHWIHGDLHPDQVIVHDGGCRLLDVDALRPGCVEEDLASWIADLLQFGEEWSFDRAAVQAVGSYLESGGTPVDAARLRALSAVALAERAAGVIRRLEVDALARAEAFLELASAIGEAR